MAGLAICRSPYSACVQTRSHNTRANDWWGCLVLSSNVRPDAIALPSPSDDRSPHTPRRVRLGDEAGSQHAPYGALCDQARVLERLAQIASPVRVDLSCFPPSNQLRVGDPRDDKGGRTGRQLPSIAGRITAFAADPLRKY